MLKKYFFLFLILKSFSLWSMTLDELDDSFDVDIDEERTNESITWIEIGPKIYLNRYIDRISEDKLAKFNTNLTDAIQTTSEYKGPIGLKLDTNTNLNDRHVFDIPTNLQLKGIRLPPDSSITDIFIEQLSLRFKDLESISLGVRNNITDAGIKHLLKLDNLKHLIIFNYNQITDNTIQEFRNKFPDIKIIGR